MNDGASEITKEPAPQRQMHTPEHVIVQVHVGHVHVCCVWWGTLITDISKRF